MIMHKQQIETLQYFKEHAFEWRLKSSEENRQNVNVIRQRNDYVIHTIKSRTITSLVLDVGCGTGALAIDLSRLGVPCIGIDFAEEMIQEAKQQAKIEQLDSVCFECASIFDVDYAPSTFDVISANGFIEYISIEELERFCIIAQNALTTEGSLVVSSRNRLFNLFSLNSFTESEIGANSLPLLLGEAILLRRGGKLTEFMVIETPEYQLPGIEHIHTGIGVSTRFQYTPAQLMKLLAKYGFDPVAISPIHIHAVSTVLVQEYPEIHGLTSNILQSYGFEKMQFVPFSSSFMLHVKKTKRITAKR